MAEPSVWIVMPAYNEGQIISDVIVELLEHSRTYNVVIVDDGSSDDTVDKSERFPVYLLRHQVNLGQGAALATGIEYALRQEADIVVTFDADGQMRAEDIDKLVEKVRVEGFDVALGSRFLKESPEVIPLLRKVVLRLAVIFTKLTTGLKITDAHNGMRAFKAEAIKKIVITQSQMAHASEILSEIARNKLRYCEVPVSIRYTDYSKAKGQSIWNSFNILYELLTGGKK